MWIFTPKGFLSAVEHNTDKKLIVLRARNENHLKEMFPGFHRIVVPKSDYPCRIIIEKEYLAAWMHNQVLNIDYGNFKNAINDDEYHDACLGVWSVMHKYGQGFYHRTKAWVKGLVNQRALEIHESNYPDYEGTPEQPIKPRHKKFEGKIHQNRAKDGKFTK